MEGFFLCFSGVRGVSGAFGRSPTPRALGHLDGGVDGKVFPLVLERFGAFRLGFGVPGLAFRVSVGEVLFEDVGIFGFSGFGIFGL